MVDELLDIVNEKNEIIFQEMKSITLKKGLWHRTAAICLINNKNQILLQKRAKNKILSPNLWDISVAGHIQAGEEPIQCAIREIEEEIGLQVNLQDLIFFNIFKSSKENISNNNSNNNSLISNEFKYLYLLNTQIEDSSVFKIQEEEIQELKFIDVKEFEIELKENPNEYTQKVFWDELIAIIKKSIIKEKYN